MNLAIGDLSRLAEVKVPTIRYYEQIGLLPAPVRTEGKQRRYGAPAVKRLNFIRHARELGFEIEDIRQLLALSEEPQDPATRPTASRGIISMRSNGVSRGSMPFVPNCSG